MNLIYLLYREIHYRVVQRNPILMNNPYRYRQALKNALSMKKGLGIQSINYLLLGFFMAMGIAFTNDKEVISTVTVFLSLIPFVFAIYITSIQGSNVVYMGVFEPLKMLPLKIGSRYLSLYLLAEISPSIGMVLPTVIVIIIKYPLEGVLSLLWFLMGIFIGHVIGLVIFTFFGLKVRQRAGKRETLRNIARAVLFFLFIGMFYAFVYMQKYIKEHSGEWASIISKYFVIYPFSVGTIFKPFYSLILLIIYGVVLFSIYYFLLRVVWSRIMEPVVISEESKSLGYKIKKSGAISALLHKDFKILLRKTALLAGFMIIVYIVFPQLFVALSTGKFPMKVAISLLFMIGVFAATGTDAILKIEANSLDFLRTLPLRKKDFVMAKTIAMCVIPWSLGFVIFFIALYFNGLKAMILIPYPIVLPLISSAASMYYYFHYKEEDIGIPDLKWSDMIILLLIIGVTMIPVALPVVFNLIWISEIIAVVEFLILIYLLRR